MFLGKRTFPIHNGFHVVFPASITRHNWHVFLGLPHPTIVQNPHAHCANSENHSRMKRNLPWTMDTVFFHLLDLTIAQDPQACSINSHAHCENHENHYVTECVGQQAIEPFSLPITKLLAPHLSRLCTNSSHAPYWVEWPISSLFHNM